MKTGIDAFCARQITFPCHSKHFVCFLTNQEYNMAIDNDNHEDNINGTNNDLYMFDCYVSWRMSPFGKKCLAKCRDFTDAEINEMDRMYEQKSGRNIVLEMERLGPMIIHNESDNDDDDDARMNTDDFIDNTDAPSVPNSDEYIPSRSIHTESSSSNDDDSNETPNDDNDDNNNNNNQSQTNNDSHTNNGYSSNQSQNNNDSPDNNDSHTNNCFNNNDSEDNNDDNNSDNNSNQSTSSSYQSIRSRMDRSITDEQKQRLTTLKTETESLLTTRANRFPPCHIPAFSGSLNESMQFITDVRNAEIRNLAETCFLRFATFLHLSIQWYNENMDDDNYTQLLQRYNDVQPYRPITTFRPVEILIVCFQKVLFSSDWCARHLACFFMTDKRIIMDSLRIHAPSTLKDVIEWRDTNFESFVSTFIKKVIQQRQWTRFQHVLNSLTQRFVQSADSKSTIYNALTNACQELGRDVNTDTSKQTQSNKQTSPQTKTTRKHKRKTTTRATQRDNTETDSHSETISDEAKTNTQQKSTDNEQTVQTNTMHDNAVIKNIKRHIPTIINNIKTIQSPNKQISTLCWILNQFEEFPDYNTTNVADQKLLTLIDSKLNAWEQFMQKHAFQYVSTEYLHQVVDFFDNHQLSIRQWPLKLKKKWREEIIKGSKRIEYRIGKQCSKILPGDILLFETSSRYTPINFKSTKCRMICAVATKTTTCSMTLMRNNNEFMQIVEEQKWQSKTTNDKEYVWSCHFLPLWYTIGGTNQTQNMLQPEQEHVDAFRSILQIHFAKSKKSRKRKRTRNKASENNTPDTSNDNNSTDRSKIRRLNANNETTTTCHNQTEWWNQRICNIQKYTFAGKEYQAAEQI